MRALRQGVLPLLALLGIGFGVLQVLRAAPAPTPAVPLAEPAAAPFESYVGGTGQVEPPGRTIALAAPAGGIATAVLVRPGDLVAAGAALIQLDDTLLRAQLREREASLAASRAQVAEAEAGLANARDLLRTAEAVSDRRAISAEELGKRRGDVALHVAKLAMARAQTLASEAQRDAVMEELARSTLRAPIHAVVLQVNTRLGEYVPANRIETPVLMLGAQGPSHVRVQVDENDAWRVRPGLRAMAYLRGNRAISAPLRFLRIEPYVVPKQSLTGSATERIDTRVLEVVFELLDPGMPAYAGQLLDVFIEAAPLPPPPSATP